MIFNSKIRTTVLLGTGTTAVSSGTIGDKKKIAAISFKTIDKQEVGSKVQEDCSKPDVLIVIETLESLKVLEDAIEEIKKMNVWN